ncbi:hypothetical protein Kpol_520p34 [Vanderwaltozyma polyspora DSM 70294]|uniref:Spore membrane assembly protein 2 n=1 Tax=Vanderwaltozyma polyspora (strain ATCC 22028 / DSM 70294 / BCRC 21397 / CBS 2163 / NBRC 10782 / NRRL Y-8283 / UCD 57-17) TaxID=436907 RepID=SMA2_VANPO|nr:uncharacterized protein Kpol_520p34 [Vanderwaltozyma polyspora DSM 70294]A7TMB7.1 RecName: Full=Spore membrane assembly protein 2 [Vanderwaltozyma polyspora DSM 70294]EDO16611.1 hypothetical protein Kpol_520p34 [Vanderwaltozyma polyspora DSM 70294]
MIFLKRFIVWTFLFIVTLIQLLLYLPDFSCISKNGGLPICTSQFNFAIVDSSHITHDFITSIRELLRLLSYLTIDMGWSSGLPAPDAYNDENLVDTFHLNNIYKVNYFGYCKKNGKQKEYCTSNHSSGMDILALLVRDVGIQLGKLSSAYENNTEILGESLVFTYELSLSSLHTFIKGDRQRGNILPKIVTNQGNEQTDLEYSSSKAYDKGVSLAYGLMLFNEIMYFIHIFEITISVHCFLNVILFGFALVWGKKQILLPTLLKITSSLLLVFASISFSGNLLYLLLLKMLEPDPTGITTTGWEMLEVKAGSGFIITCIRVGIQWIFLPVAFITSNHYIQPKKQQTKIDELKSDDESTVKQV